MIGWMDEWLNGWTDPCKWLDGRIKLMMNIWMITNIDSSVNGY